MRPVPSAREQPCHLSELLTCKIWADLVILRQTSLGTLSKSHHRACSRPGFTPRVRFSFARGRLFTLMQKRVTCCPEVSQHAWTDSRSVVMVVSANTESWSYAVLAAVAPFQVGRSTVIPSSVPEILLLFVVSGVFVLFVPTIRTFPLPTITLTWAQNEDICVQWRPDWDEIWKDPSCQGAQNPELWPAPSLLSWWASDARLFIKKKYYCLSCITAQEKIRRPLQNDFSDFTTCCIGLRLSKMNIFFRSINYYYYILYTFLPNFK